MAEWQPIETAPKDGTEILVFYERAGARFVHIAWWENHSNNFWFYLSSVSQDALGGDNAPTHWMPMPVVPNG
jgi:hypothetical protein